MKKRAFVKTLLNYVDSWLTNQIMSILLSSVISILSLCMVYRLKDKFQWVFNLNLPWVCHHNMELNHSSWDNKPCLSLVLHNNHSIWCLLKVSNHWCTNNLWDLLNRTLIWVCQCKINIRHKIHSISHKCKILAILIQRLGNDCQTFYIIS